MQTPHQNPIGSPAQGTDTAIAREVVPLREQMSALMDGACAGSDVDRVSQAYAESAELQRAWAEYHCIGLALRSEREAVPPAESAFVAGVMARIAQDAVRPTVPEVVVRVASDVASNDAVFRWKMVAGVASMAAVAAVAWQLVSSPMTSVGPQMARSTETVQESGFQVVVTPQGSVMLRDPQLDEFMAAHRQWGGVSALQMPAGFLRNATYENSQR